MHHYLELSEFVDWHHPDVLVSAAELADGAGDALEIARRSFEFVCDKTKHSGDFRLNPVTCAASQVLKHRTGYCYAKSHLLAALLCSNGIPAGLCYQRLAVESAGPPYCLHGLNAAYFRAYGWYRFNARGNRPGVLLAEFSPPIERLAFPVAGPGEADLAEIWAEPLPIIVQTLLEHATYEDVYNNLPDVEVLTSLPAARRRP